jgi:hypothetical protein
MTLTWSLIMAPVAVWLALAMLFRADAGGDIGFGDGEGDGGCGGD